MEKRFDKSRGLIGVVGSAMDFGNKIDKGPNTRPYSDLGDAFAYLVLASGEAGVLSRVAKPQRANAVVGGYDDESWFR
jgi:hypothetical protein